MTSKERVLASLAHKQPDKMAVDFGAHCVSMMHVSCISQLRDYYGLEKKPIVVKDTATMTGEVDSELQKIIGCDVDGVFPYKGPFGLGNFSEKKVWNYMGIDVLMPAEFEISNDGNGGFFLYPQGDRTAPASGHMPKDGFYFDDIIRQDEVDEDNLDYRDNMEEYKPITEIELQTYKTQVENLKKSGRAVLLTAGFSAMGDIATIPGHGLKYPKGIRRIEDWYTAPLLYPEFVHELFDHQSDLAIENWKKIYETVGNDIDVMYICGTDFGSQHSLISSKETFDTFFKPYYKKMNNWIHSNTNWKTLKHSCGAIAPVIPGLIEAEFDALNPIQCTAVGMEDTMLKREFGKDITFWGGGVDTQTTLPFGTPDQVREQVLRRCDLFSKDGGFIFNTIHVIQCKTPIENIVAMIDAVHEFNGDK